MPKGLYFLRGRGGSMRRTGIVMSTQGRMAVVLTKDGEFCQVPCQEGTQIGMEIDWASSMSNGVVDGKRRSTLWHLSRVRKVVATGIAAAVLVTAGFWYYSGSVYAATPYAFVSIDINPSVSLVLNRHLHVIKAVPQNADGEKLLSHLKLKGEVVGAAVKDIVDAAVSEQMLPQSDNIVVATAPAHNVTSVADVQKEVKDDVAKAVAGNAKAKKLAPSVYSLSVSNTVWKVATDKHVSPGKVGAVLLAKKHGMVVSPNEAGGDVLKAVMNVVGTKDSDVNVSSPQAVQQVISEVQQLDSTPVLQDTTRGTIGDDSTTHRLKKHGKGDLRGQSSNRHKPNKGHGRGGSKERDNNTTDDSQGVIPPVSGTPLHSLSSILGQSGLPVPTVPQSGSGDSNQTTVGQAGHSGLDGILNSLTGSGPTTSHHSTKRGHHIPAPPRETTQNAQGTRHQQGTSNTIGGASSSGSGMSGGTQSNSLSNQSTQNDRRGTSRRRRNNQGSSQGQWGNTQNQRRNPHNQRSTERGQRQTSGSELQNQIESQNPAGSDASEQYSTNSHRQARQRGHRQVAK